VTEPDFQMFVDVTTNTWRPGTNFMRYAVFGVTDRDNCRLLYGKQAVSKETEQ